MFVYLFDLVNLFRFFMFIWPLLLLPTAYVIQKSNWNKLLSLLLVGFVVVNMCGYHTIQYDRSLSPNYLNGEHDRKIQIQTKAPVLKFNFTGRLVGNHYFAMVFEGYKDKEIQGDIDFYLKDYKKENKFSWLFLNKKDHSYISIRGGNPLRRRVGEDLYNSYQLFFDKTYVNGKTEIYKVDTD